MSKRICQKELHLDALQHTECAYYCKPLHKVVRHLAEGNPKLL